MSFQKYEFVINKDKTCFYGVKSPSSIGPMKYETITWLHIKSVSNISLDIDFVSSHHINNDKNETSLVIITGNRISNSNISITSLYPKRVQILVSLFRSIFHSLIIAVYWRCLSYKYFHGLSGNISVSTSIIYFVLGIVFRCLNKEHISIISLLVR